MVTLPVLEADFVIVVAPSVREDGVWRWLLMKTAKLEGFCIDKPHAVGEEVGEKMVMRF